jgi:hypothetical protein
MIQLRNFLFFLLLTKVKSLYGQVVLPVGARANALANTSITVNDCWSYFHNPGVVPVKKSVQVGVFYQTRFLAKEVQQQALTGVIPVKKGAFSVGAQFYGYEQFRFSRIGMGYALALSDNISFGVQGNLNQLRLGGNYGSTLKGTIEAGFLATLSPKWKMGMSVFNIGRQTIWKNGDRYGTTMKLGASYEPSIKVKTLFELEKQVLYPMNAKCAFEYFPNESFAIRIGTQTQPFLFAFGFSYLKNKLQIDLSSQFHSYLGWTPGIGFNYQFKQHEK